MSLILMYPKTYKMHWVPKCSIIAKETGTVYFNTSFLIKSANRLKNPYSLLANTSFALSDDFSI